MEKSFDYKYLSKKHLKGLDTYKYSAVDTSPLSNYVMHPLWNNSVKILPRWLAPNLLTFLGFVLMVLLVGLLNDKETLGKDGIPVPGWVYTTCAVFLFLAYNLDGLDGKQARRIGVSGPLGEMFDHGIDSYVVFFIPYGFMSVFGRDHEFTIPVFRGFLLVVSVCLNFYVSHWEKYSTGTLYLPWGYDVSMWASAILYLLPGLYGPRVYHTYLFGDVTLLQGLEVVVHATGLFTTLPMAIYNVYMVSKNRRSLQKSLLQTLRPVWSMALMNLVIIAWALRSPNGIIQYDPKAFILIYGTHFSNISVRQLCSHYRISCFTVPKTKKK